MEIFKENAVKTLSFSDRELQLVIDGLQAIGIRGYERQDELIRQHDSSGRLIPEHQSIGECIIEAQRLEESLRVFLVSHQNNLG